MKHWRLILLLALLGTALASTTVKAVGYYTNGSATQIGMIVSGSANAGVIEPSNRENASATVGVIGQNPPSTGIGDQPLEAGQVNVRTEGEVTTLVSDLDGSIKVGDRIAPSQLQGIGTKAGGNGWIVGIAQASFDKSSAEAVRSQVTDTSGKQHDVHVGRIPVILQITYYNPGSAQVTTKKDNSIQAFADKLAGRKASELGILLSVIILFVGLVIVGLLINGILKGGFTAIGRQPLIRDYLIGVIAKSLAVAGLILLAVFAAAYMLLRVL